MKHITFILFALFASITLSAQDIDLSAELDQIAGNTYLSEGGDIKLKYDFANKRIYILAQKPMMCHSQGARNIALVNFYIGDTEKYVLFDMSNKVLGVALCSGSYAYVANSKFHRFFKKTLPTSFDILIPYETSTTRYTLTLQE